jgi:hypothetical protein
MSPQSPRGRRQFSNLVQLLGVLRAPVYATQTWRRPRCQTCVNTKPHSGRETGAENTVNTFRPHHDLAKQRAIIYIKI